MYMSKHTKALFVEELYTRDWNNEDLGVVIPAPKYGPGAIVHAHPGQVNIKSKVVRTFMKGDTQVVVVQRIS
jgi:hypothetical protein